MDLLTAILACSLYFDDQLTEAIVDANSGGNQFFVGYVATRAIVFEQPTTAQAASVALDQVIKAGGRPSLGLMAVPPGWGETFGRRPEELWDTCTNVSIGTAMLSTFASECRPPKRLAKQRSRARRPASTTPDPRLRACVIHRYAAALGTPDLAQAIFRELLSPRSGDTRKPPPGAPERAEGSPRPHPEDAPASPAPTSAAHPAPLASPALAVPSAEVPILR